MKCSQPGCAGTIADGYCDTCGLSAKAASVAVAAGGALSPGSAATAASSRLAQTPMGSARSGSSASRPTKRLSGAASSRLGAGLTNVPAAPLTDPRQALMDPPVVAEDKRFCSSCQAEVGRAKGGSAGRTKGFCPQCGTAFDFDPKLRPGSLLGGQYEVVGCLAHGGMGWIYLARDRNVNDRWVVLKGLLNTADVDASRAAVAEKQFLAEVEHPLIVEIYNFVTAPDGASYIVMEYVGGRSINTMLKDRMKAAGGTFDGIPVDQALAYIIEILPAFSYLHSLGLLYCDFKPANMIQVGDSLKLIDLGGVRRQDDDQSAIYGTVGFQAPEVAREGCTVASDVYTIARTLAVMTFEFRGYQSQHEFSLPDPSTVPLLAQHDALYRWLVKGTATEPHDRFQTAEEMRQQLLGVLREVTAGATKGAVVRATPSALFTSPGLGVERLGWLDLPVCMVDVDDPMASWIAAVTTDEPGARDDALEGAPEKTAGVLAERAMAALRLGLPGQAHALCESMLQRDPWEWRAVYIQGLVAMACGDFGAAVGSFNAVYGQLPGELAPKLALAAACEANDEHDVAERLYRTCARTDAAYVAPAQFGLARLAAASGRREEALTALDQIPKTSAAFGESRRRRLELLIEGIDPSRRSADLATAAVELRSASLPTEQAIGMRINIFAALLRTIEVNGRIDGHIDGSPADESRVRTELETLYRQAARQATDHDERVRLVDEANRVRPRTRS